MTLTLTIGAGAEHPQGARHDVADVAAFVQMLREHDCPNAWWSAHEFNDDYRSDDSRKGHKWESSCAIVVDVDFRDHATPPDDQRPLLEQVAIARAATLFHHTPHGGRIVWVLRAQCEDAALWERAARAECAQLDDLLGGSGFAVDKASWDKVHFFWTPNANVAGVQRSAEVLQLGDAVDLQDLLPAASAAAAPPAHAPAREPAAAGCSPRAMPIAEATVTRIRDALRFVDNDSRDNWIAMGMALKSTSAREQAFEIWDQWSRTVWHNHAPVEGQVHEKHNRKEKQRAAWNSLAEYRQDGSERALATLFYRAKKGGWAPAPAAVPAAPSAAAQQNGHVADAAVPARAGGAGPIAESASRFANDLTDAAAAEWGARLRVPPEALRKMGAGLLGSALTLPMLNAAGEVCGVWKHTDGNKPQASKGHKLGRFGPLEFAGSGPLLVCVDAIDCAAAIGLGYDAVGLCTDAREPKLAAVEAAKDRDVVIVAQLGAQLDRFVGDLKGVAKGLRELTLPGAGNGSLVAWTDGGWTDGGGTREQLDQLIAQADDLVRRAPGTVVSVLERWEREGALQHVPTGFPELDEMTRGGLVAGFLTAVVGAPEASKTLVLVALADRWSTQGLVVGVLAVDEDEDGLVTRLLQRRDHARDVCEARVPEQLRDARNRFGENRDLLRFYDDTWTIEDAATDLAAFAKEQGRRAALLVDSLQTVTSTAEEGERGLREQVTMRMRALKRVCRKHRLLVCTTSEMARAGYGKKEGRPDDLAAGKESGAIEYSAKVLLSLRGAADPQRRDLVQLRAVKNKLGEIHDPADLTAGIYLRLDKDHQTLVEEGDNYVPPAQGASRDRGREQARDDQLHDAAAVAAVIASKPGLSVKLLRAAVRARLGKAGNDRVDVALHWLDDAVRIVRKGTQTMLHYLDGRAMGDLLLAKVPAEERPMVSAAVAPPGSIPRPEIEAEKGSDDADE